MVLMVRVRINQKQIRRVIVRLVEVNVVDMLGWRKRTTNLLGHHKPMLFDKSAWHAIYAVNVDNKCISKSICVFIWVNSTWSNHLIPFIQHFEEN